jgi:hypothetical protein
MDNTQTQPNTSLDPSIVNLARAISQTETSGSSDPYTAQGKSGEYGAYQYTAPTWASDSQKYLGQAIPLNQATPAQQDQVAYEKIKDLGTQGYNPSQIASIWNSGKPNPTGNVGTNKYGVSYDTPQYVQSVGKVYSQLQSGQQTTPQQTASSIPNQPGQPNSQGYITSANIPQPTPQQTASSIPNQPGQPNSQGYITSANIPQPTPSAQTSPDQQGLGQQLSGQAQFAGNAFSDLGNQLSGQKGTKNWWSDLLDIGGAAGGAVGDLVNAGLGLIPGVKQGEQWLGGEVGKAADTQVGQSVVSSLQQFQQSHPELSQDAGDVFNIATAFPMLRGIGAIADVAKSGLGSALSDAVVSGVQKDMEDAVGEDVSDDVVKSMTDNGIMPNIVKASVGNSTGWVYDSSDAIDSLSEASKAGTIPASQVTDIGKILTEMDGEPWTPGKIVSSISKGAKWVGGATGEAVGTAVHPLLGTLGGLGGGTLVGNAVGGLAGRVASSAINPALGSTLSGAISPVAGLVGAALAQKLKNKVSP